MSKRQRARGGGASPEDAQLQGHRHQRLQQIIREELDALFRTEISDPALEGVRVVSAELSVDYRSVRVRFYTPDEADAPKALRALEHAHNFVRNRLVESLDLKRSPTLSFKFDHDAAAAARAAAMMDAERPTVEPPAQEGGGTGGRRDQEDDRSSERPAGG